MSLPIATFSNASGPECLFKALGHPLATDLGDQLLCDLRSFGSVAIYDPFNFFDTFAALHSMEDVEIKEAYVQDINHVGRDLGGVRTQPISLLPLSRANVLFIVAFDVDRLVSQIEPLLPSKVEHISLDHIRLPENFLSNPRHYLSPLNFGTNFAFFRDSDGLHTRLTSTNYWHGYGASRTKLWLRLFDEDGVTLASWEETLADQGTSIVIDSRDVRKRFDLGPFTGQLFVHATKIVGHEIIKYVLDIFDDRYETLSCTHDANAWPAELYAGLPTPAPGEEVTLWVQNSHPVVVPPNSIGLRCMGEKGVSWIEKCIKPFATIAINVADFFPNKKWGKQLEVLAGKYVVRPRYEITDSDQRKRISHVNIERTDLVPDPNLAKISQLVGKGYLLPAPILPTKKYDTTILWTPMATTQERLSADLSLYDTEGVELASKLLKIPSRGEAAPISIQEWLPELDVNLLEGVGHIELTYDFSDDVESDGWLHAIFRYKNLISNHQTETSFGTHMFNLPITYGKEPQSYAGSPPGLTTRLYVRLGEVSLDTVLHLIYPASRPWREKSETQLTLMNSSGVAVSDCLVEIPCGGSRLYVVEEVFGSKAIRKAGSFPYVVIRDFGCRLFGYHALTHPNGAFCLDHMFGF